jgi:uncharacterized protein GlcG (DUF336 family)
MNGAALLDVRDAQAEGWTAISFSLPMHGLWEFIKDDPPLPPGLPQQKNFIVFGALPHHAGGEVIWGVGGQWGALPPGPAVRRGGNGGHWSLLNRMGAGVSRPSL